MKRSPHIHNWECKILDGAPCISCVCGAYVWVQGDFVTINTGASRYVIEENVRTPGMIEVTIQPRDQKISREKGSGHDPRP